MVGKHTETKFRREEEEKSWGYRQFHWCDAVLNQSFLCWTLTTIFSKKNWYKKEVVTNYYYIMISLFFSAFEASFFDVESGSFKEQKQGFVVR